MWLKRKSQSILEYAILIAVVVAAILIMQTFMKRGVQGRLKDSSEKIGGGTSYSASGTTILEDRHMNATSNRVIEESTATGGTDSPIAKMQGMAGMTVHPTGDKAYSATAVSGGETKSKTLTKTADAANETFKQGDYSSNTVGDFTATDFDDDSKTPGVWSAPGQ